MTTSMNISEVNFSLTDDTQDLDMMSRQGLHSAQRSEILSPINELSSAMPTSPEESNIFPAGVDFDDIMPDTFGKSRKSFEIVDNVKILDTAESWVLIEPEQERSTIPGYRTESDPLYEWLSALNVQYLYNVLVDSGFDDVDSMIDQMRSPLPITQDSLVDIGVDKPGHAMRIVCRLEDEAGLVDPRTRRRQVSISQKPTKSGGLF